MLLIIALTIVSLLIVFTSFIFFSFKDTFAKIQVVSALNSLVIIWISIYCYYIEKPQYIDIALLYAVLSYIAILSFKKYFQISLEEHQK